MYLEPHSTRASRAQASGRRAGYSGTRRAIRETDQAQEGKAQRECARPGRCAVLLQLAAAVEEVCEALDGHVGEREEGAAAEHARVRSGPGMLQ